MSPSDTFDDNDNGSFGNTKLVSQSFIANDIPAVEIPNFQDILFSQFSIPVLTASWCAFRFCVFPVFYSQGLSILRNHVCRVLGDSAEKKVIRVDAHFHIAVMTDEPVIWNRPLIYKERETVGRYGASVVPHFSVMTLRPTDKNPTWTKFWAMGRNWSVFIYFFPESVYDIFWKLLRGVNFGGTLILHSIRLFDCLPRLRLFVQRAGNFLSYFTSYKAT